MNNKITDSQSVSTKKKWKHTKETSRRQNCCTFLE